MGTIPATGYESSVVQTFSSPTGTSHTMTYTASVSDMILVINNVIQEPTVAYTTSGTTLTTGTLISGDTMYIVYLALSRQTVAPGADTVTNAMIVDDAINSEHYTDGSIDLAHMSVNSIDSDQYVDGSIDLAHMSADSVDSSQYVDASIDNAHLADDAVNSDELAAGAVDLAHMSATGTASSSTFLRGDNAWVAPGGITLGTPVASTSGTTIDFTSIPAGTKRITVSFLGVSEASSQGVEVVLGDSGGFEITGYLNTVTDIETTVDHDDFTDAFSLTTAGGYSSDNNITGTITLVLENSSSFTWIAQTTVMRHAADGQYIGNGSKSLSAELTQVRIQTSGGSAFDAGEINISYE